MAEKRSGKGRVPHVRKSVCGLKTMGGAPQPLFPESATWGEVNCRSSASLGACDFFDLPCFAHPTRCFQPSPQNRHPERCDFFIRAKMMAIDAERRPPSATVLSLQPPSPICHPDRTRISYFTALASDAYVVLLKENHMQLIEVATLDRKSGAGEGPAVYFTSKQSQLEAPSPLWRG